MKPTARISMLSLCVAAMAATLTPNGYAAALKSASAPAVPPADGGETALPPGVRIGNYVGEDVMIPMRDGVRLHAQVWRPVGAKGKLPILMQRSPYGFPVERLKGSFAKDFKELADEGYIFVLQDIRGRFGSEGDFVMLRPMAKSAAGIDEATDTYDSIAWLTKSLPYNNGKVGIFGISYGGWTAAMATIAPHPALKAVSVQASPEDMFVGDDFHHNGAFRLDYAWEYSAALETDGRTMKVFDFGKDDPYAWFLKQPELAKLDVQHVGRPLPTWQNFVQHPDYDAFWREQVTSVRMPKMPTVPNLIVAGWWDQEDFYGPLEIYKNQEKGDQKNRNFLVIGPWNHGGWSHGDGRTYGPFDFGSATGTYFREQVQAKWFRHWLKDEGTLQQPEALVFQTGSNMWKSYKHWPPREGVQGRNLYLHAGGRLSFDPPKPGEAASHRFTSDPADPVPYRERPIDAFLGRDSTWAQWLADDQAPFAKRADVLFWQTDVLTQDLTIAGDVAAKLFASTTGSDADWVVKLIDVYPSDASVPAPLRGRQLMIANDVFRGRFRSGLSTPKPLTPGAVLDYDIDLHAASHVFRKGHRVAVQIQSSWFPLIDRNPQTFVPNIFNAKPADFKAQTHTVFHDPSHPSAIAVSVATDDKQP
jgi:putative CocE/NonD family hydrolase